MDKRARALQRLISKKKNVAIVGRLILGLGLYIQILKPAV